MFLDGDRNEYGLTIADPKRGIFHQFKVNYCGEFFPVGDSLYQDIVMVSIHAPARGATVLGFIYLFLRSYNAFFAKYYIVSCFCVYYAYFYSQVIEY